MIAISIVAACGIPVLIWGAALTWNRETYYPIVAATIAALLTISLMAIHLTAEPTAPPADYLPARTP